MLPYLILETIYDRYNVYSKHDNSRHEREFPFPIFSGYSLVNCFLSRSFLFQFLMLEKYIHYRAVLSGNSHPQIFHKTFPTAQIDPNQLRFDKYLKQTWTNYSLVNSEI